jgi:hypothetical protein
LKTTVSSTPRFSLGYDVSNQSRVTVVGGRGVGSAGVGGKGVGRRDVGGRGVGKKLKLKISGVGGRGVGSAGVG